jgi:hypothetical protein
MPDSHCLSVGKRVQSLTTKPQALLSSPPLHPNPSVSEVQTFGGEIWKEPIEVHYVYFKSRRPVTAFVVPGQVYLTQKRTRTSQKTR